VRGAPDVLKPGEIVHATSASISVTREPVKELERALSWRRGMLVFDHASVAAAVKEFNRYNDEKLIVADAHAGALTFSSAFPINGIEAFVRLAQKTLGLHVERHGGAIVISR
jgi:transmembrane sensor